MSQNNQQQYHQAVTAAHQAISQAQFNADPQQLQQAQQHVNQAHEQLEALIQEQTKTQQNSFL